MYLCIYINVNVKSVTLAKKKGAHSFSLVVIIKKENNVLTLLYPTLVQVTNSRTEIHVGSFHKRVDVKYKLR